VDGSQWARGRFDPRAQSVQRMLVPVVDGTHAGRAPTLIAETPHAQAREHVAITRSHLGTHLFSYLGVRLRWNRSQFSETCVTISWNIAVGTFGLSRACKSVPSLGPPRSAAREHCVTLPRAGTKHDQRRIDQHDSDNHRNESGAPPRYRDCRRERT
jgi:hypothetical protein